MPNNTVLIDTIKKTINLQGGVNVDITKQENGQYLIECADLDLATWGDSPEECVTEMQDVLRGYLETLNDLGTLYQVLSESGWKVLENEREVHIIPPFVIKTMINLNSEKNATISAHQN
jgi:predicted RNase H-like HicB family nuclease